MKKSRFRDEQIIAFLRQVEGGVPVNDLLCSAITRSRQRGHQTIFVMQPTQHRSGAHREALADPRAGHWCRSRHHLSWRVRHAWTKRRVRASAVVLTHP